MPIPLEWQLLDNETGAFDGWLTHVREDGTAHPTRRLVAGRVLTTHPSVLGDGLVDIATTARIEDPLPATQRPVWDIWRRGGPAELDQ
jgi:hypothetical protein